MRVRSHIAVVVHRSRDALRSGGLVGLDQDERFRVTENYRRLADRTLDRCDVLIVQSCAAAGYTATELAAIRRFVRRGGGLLLTTSAAIFETAAGKPVTASAAQQVADLFKVRFLSPSEAKGRTHHDEWLNCGYPRADLALSARGPLKGFRLDDLVVRRASPLALPRGAQVLLRHRRTREPVAAALRVGRGRVLVAGHIEFGSRWQTVGRAVAEWLAVPSRRRETKPLPEVLASPWQALKQGTLRVRFRGTGRRRVENVLPVVSDLTGRFEGMIGRKQRPLTWHVEIAPGAGARLDWNWRTGLPTLRVGVHTAQPSLVYDLAFGITRHLIGWRGGYSGWFYGSIGLENFCMHLALRAMEWYGFDEEAARRRAILESWPDYPSDPRQVDLGRWYSETGPSPAIWVWRALEEDFGPQLIDRFLKRQPRRRDRDASPYEDVFMPLDVVIYYLSLAAKRDLYPWFAERGTTVHPLPLVPTKDKSFKRRCLAAIRRQLRDASQPLSERFDAARALFRRRSHVKLSLGRALKPLASHDESKRLVAAATLARARDERGTRALRRIATRSKDPALAAIAACVLVDAGDESVAHRLAELAKGADARFRHDARAALNRLARRSPSPSQGEGRGEGRGSAAGDRLPLTPALSPQGRGRRTVDAPVRITAVRDGDLRLYPEVEGYGTANVFSSLSLNHWPQGIVVPQLFIEWVHTSAKWRRKGFSRALFDRIDSDRWAREAVTGGLWTEPVNTAHPLYRSRGFIDLMETEEWTRSLKHPPHVPRVRGVAVRRAVDRDAPRMADLYNEVYRDYFNVRRRRAEPLARDAVAVVALKGKRTVGFLVGSLRGPDRTGNVAARLHKVCVKAGKDCQSVTHALAARWCTLAARRGAVRAGTRELPESDPVRRGFEAAGFSRRSTEGVVMWRLLNLPRLLTLIRPLLEHRLKENKRADWCGTIAILGRKHRAALKLDRGKVTVLTSIPRSPNVTLSGSDDVISRIIAGRRTPYQALLQLDLRITPRPSRDITATLDFLFPKMPMYLD